MLLLNLPLKPSPQHWVARMVASTSFIEALAAEAVAALETGQQIATVSARRPEFTLDDAYRVTEAVRRLRRSRGATPLGRKIGFTNRTTWPDYAPMWSYVYDRTVHDLDVMGATFPLERLAEPRIEPEIAFRLAAAPTPGMDERALLACIDGVAHGFEIVQSIFPGWAFTEPDAVAAFGLHGALLLGPWHPMVDPDAWERSLRTFSVELECNGTMVDRGNGTLVLGGPLTALRCLVELLADKSMNPPLAAGEIITTGTLTGVPPVAPGQTWSTVLSGIGIAGLTVRFS